MKNRTLIYVFIAIFLAFVAGILSEGYDPLIKLYGLIGGLFLNGLTLLVVPLVAASIITGTARMSAEKGLGTLGAKTFGFFILTTLLAILVGFASVELLQPGTFSTQSMETNEQFAFSEELEKIENSTKGDLFDKVEQILFKLVPSNILSAAASGQMLGILGFSFLFGFFIPKIEAPYLKAVLDFWRGVFQVMMRITLLLMKALPFGVFGLVAKTVAKMGLGSLGSAAYFSFTVLIALLVYAGVLLPLILRLGGIDPWKHLRALSPALITAFSTSSSSATMPVTMECLEKQGIPQRICSFAVPLGTSFNPAGSSLYQCVVVFFVAQLYGIELSVANKILVVLMSLLTSIGLAGIPSACLVSIVVTLQTLGISPDGMAITLIVERLFDMLRTAVNVFSNCSCVTLVAHSKKLVEIEEPVEPMAVET